MNHGDNYEDMIQIIKNSENPGIYFNFVISNGWINKFIYGALPFILNLAHRAQENAIKDNNKVDTITNYLYELNKISQQYPPHLIVQMEDKLTYIDMLAIRTVDIKGTRTVELHHTGHLKSRFTTVLTIAANGYRLPSYLILRKLKRPPRNLITNNNIVVTASDSGFMDEDIMIDYMNKIIIPYIGSNKCLLVLDDYRAHKTEQVIQYACKNKIQPFLIPAGFTYCLQPLDVSVNKPFKDILKRKWKTWDQNSTRVTKSGNKSKPTWQQTISMVDSSTKELKTSIIRKSFLKCGFFLSNEYDAFMNTLNHYVLKYIRDETDWTKEIQLFDAMQTLPFYPYKWSEFVQHDAADIPITNTGNDEEDDELDNEIASIERVITDSREWEHEREIQIDDTITQVINGITEIDLDEEIFTL